MENYKIQEKKKSWQYCKENIKKTDTLFRLYNVNSFYTYMENLNKIEHEESINGRNNFIERLKKNKVKFELINLLKE